MSLLRRTVVEIAPKQTRGDRDTCQPPAQEHALSVTRGIPDALQLSLASRCGPAAGPRHLRSRPGQPVAAACARRMFEVQSDGRVTPSAVTASDRCRQVRYAAIGVICVASAALLVAFEFQPSGHDRKRHPPIVRMDWARPAAAVSAAAYRARCAPAITRRRGVSRELLRHGIAHGDIQPTNVIVESATGCGRSITTAAPYRNHGPAEHGTRAAQFEHLVAVTAFRCRPRFPAFALDPRCTARSAVDEPGNNRTG
jgi:hypothetical protein